MKIITFINLVKAVAVFISLALAQSKLNNQTGCWPLISPRRSVTATTDCPQGTEKQGSLCFEYCREGYKGYGPVCFSSTSSDSYKRSFQMAITCQSGMDLVGVKCYDKCDGKVFLGQFCRKECPKELPFGCGFACLEKQEMCTLHLFQVVMKMSDLVKLVGAMYNATRPRDGPINALDNVRQRKDLIRKAERELAKEFPKSYSTGSNISLTRLLGLLPDCI
jgi:hypothetical protein